MKKKIIYSVIIIAVFYLTSLLKYLYAYAIWGIDNYNALPFYARLFMTQVPVLMICMITAYFIVKDAGKNYTDMMGLSKNIKESLLIALLCCSPMLIGYYFIKGDSINTDPVSLFASSLWPGVNEELLYRAFLFGLLIRLCGWNFWIALLAPGFLFASGHLYQAESSNEALRIFLFTTLAGAGFAMFYVGWKWNIWFPIFMHFFMDFSWTFYGIPSNVLGNSQANLLRFVSIGLGIYYTIRKMKFYKINLKNIYN